MKTLFSKIMTILVLTPTLGFTAALPSGPNPSLVDGASTSIRPLFADTGFGPSNIPFDLALLTLLIVVSTMFLSSYLQKKRKKFMESRRISEFSMDESIFFQ